VKMHLWMCIEAPTIFAKKVMEWRVGTQKRDRDSEYSQDVQKAVTLRLHPGTELRSGVMECICVGDSSMPRVVVRIVGEDMQPSAVVLAQNCT
jgi:hypothetical protein